MSYLGLTHLRIEHALDYLKNQHAIAITKEDIVSYCEEGYCHARVRTYDQAGWTEDSEDNQYGVGHQQLLNPGYIFSPSDSIVLELLGEIRTGIDEPVQSNQEWKLRIRKTDLRIFFLQSDLDDLAAHIKSSKGGAKPSSPSRAELLIIAGMLEIILTDTKKRTQDRVADDLQTIYTSVTGMSKRTISGIFSEAKKAKNGLGVRPAI